MLEELDGPPEVHIYLATEIFSTAPMLQKLTINCPHDFTPELFSALESSWTAYPTLEELMFYMHNVDNLIPFTHTFQSVKPFEEVWLSFDAHHSEHAIWVSPPIVSSSSG
jgi:hypothetical protein